MRWSITIRVTVEEGKGLVLSEERWLATEELSALEKCYPYGIYTFPLLYLEIICCAGEEKIPKRRISVQDDCAESYVLLLSSYVLSATAEKWYFWRFLGATKKLYCLY